jgi:hypothetical protein
MHGDANATKTINDKADSGVNVLLMESSNSKPPDSEMSFNTASVATTISLATKPVRNATDVFQSAKPRGLNIGEINVPI